MCNYLFLIYTVLSDETTLSKKIFQKVFFKFGNNFCTAFSLGGQKVCFWSSVKAGSRHLVVRYDSQIN